jgi:lysophospholipase L1-like esterase
MAKINFTSIFSYSGLHSAGMKALILVLVLAFVGCGAIAPPKDVPAPPHVQQAATVTTVFIGDSITQFWDQNGNTLPIAGAVDAGIAGEVSASILVRFGTDVLAQNPKQVFILAGTNDTLQFQSVTAALANIESMIEQAQAAEIKVFVGSLPPVAADICNRGPQYCGHNFNPDIDLFNQQLALMVANHPGTTLLDYHSVLYDPANDVAADGMLIDGVHPSPAGYAAMDALISR